MFTVNQLLADRFRCPDTGVEFDWPMADNSPEGFFQFGDDILCYGQSNALPLGKTVSEPLHDALADVRIESGRCVLPFDPAEVVNNLCHERYVRKAAFPGNGHGFHDIVRQAYYGVRPLLPVRVRKHCQRMFLSGRMDTPFPHWPVDRTVDRLLERLLALSLETMSLDRIPFIWFWPDGRSAARST